MVQTRSDQNQSKDHFTQYIHRLHRHKRKAKTKQNVKNRDRKLSLQNLAFLFFHDDPPRILLVSIPLLCIFVHKNPKIFPISSIRKIIFTLEVFPYRIIIMSKENEIYLILSEN